MSLITINADLTRTADAIERLALAVERLVFLTVHPRARLLLQNIPVPEGVEKPKPPVKPAGLSALSTYSEDEAWLREQEAQRLQNSPTPEDYYPPVETGAMDPAAGQPSNG